MRSYLSAPLRVDLNLTNRCHLSCKYCYASANQLYDHFTRELNVSELDKLFSELEGLGVFRIQLAGGEPLLRSDFLEIVSNINKYDFVTSLNTTGFFLTQEICRSLAKGNFELVTVSLEGNNTKLHESIKGGVSYERALTALELLRESSLNTAIGITLNTYNIGSIFETIDLVRNLGVGLVGIQVLCPVGRLMENLDFLPDRKKYVKFVSELIRYQKKNPYPKINLNATNEGSVCWEYFYPLEKINRLKLLKSIWGQDPSYIENEISCTAGISVCSIGDTGEVYPCEMFCSDSNMSAGNIRDKSFREIWNSSKLFADFRSLAKGNLKGACASCKYKWCGGGCRAVAYYSTGKLNGADTHCYYAQKEK